MAVPYPHGVDIRERYGFSKVTLATQQGGAGKTLVASRSAGRSD